MAVAHAQINELYETLRAYLGHEEMKLLLGDLTETVAYRRNKSFRETIDRLKDEWQRRDSAV